MGLIFDEDDYIIAPLGDSYIFPNPQEASDEGLLAYGGDLNPNRLLSAYKKGIFPWYSKDDPILWWSPNPRLLIYPENFKMSKSFKRVLKNGNYSVKFDCNFEKVIDYCSEVPREGQDGTWITDEIKEAYIELHKMGFAHSVEAYDGDELIGGLYGISIGKAFCGESMFSLKANGSKIALKGLADILFQEAYHFIDCQLPTDHLISLGGEVLPRDIFLYELKDSLLAGNNIGSWSDYQWKYNQ